MYKEDGDLIVALYMLTLNFILTNRLVVTPNMNRTNHSISNDGNNIQTYRSGKHL